MSCRVQCHSLPDYPSWALEVHLRLWAVYTFFLYLSLDCCWQVSRRDLPPGWSASLQDWLWHHGSPTTVEGQLCLPQSKTYFSRALLVTEFAPWVCRLWRWLGGGASTWSEAVHWVHLLWGLSGGAGQDQLPPVFCPGPPSMSYKVIHRCLLLLPGL